MPLRRVRVLWQRRVLRLPSCRSITELLCDVSTINHSSRRYTGRDSIRLRSISRRETVSVIRFLTQRRIGRLADA